MLKTVHIPKYKAKESCKITEVLVHNFFDRMQFHHATYVAEYATSLRSELSQFLYTFYQTLIFFHFDLLGQNEPWFIFL